MHRQQMELSLASQQLRQSSLRRQRRQSRARWWFAQMHQIVEHARSWPSGLADRSRQEAPGRLV